MKSKLFLQYSGKEVSDAELIQAVKDAWKESGKMIKDLKELNLYLKPEENMAYYTINDGEVTGQIQL